jgi:arylsulfatase
MLTAKINSSAIDSVSGHVEPTTVSQSPPNILLIILDDVGFGDTSTFGGPAQTPALDALAAQGLRYNHFHTAGLCSPTRAALLSGRNHHKVGYGVFGGVDHPGYDGIWRKTVAPFAEVLRRNGYSTSAFGKWHNTPGSEITPVGPFERWPTGLGFEYYYGNMLGVSSQWEPPLWRNTLPVQQPYLPEEGYHYTTDLVDDAIGWVRTHESLAPQKPFFMYFATGAAHGPHHVPTEWINKYRGRFDKGWDRLRQDTFERQKQLGVVPAGTKLTPRPPGIPAWSSLSADEKELFARQMEIFAAFVAHTDYEVGRLIDAVRDGPNGENTLILYVVGDNGDDSAGGRRGNDNIYKGLGGGQWASADSVQEQLHRIKALGGPLSNSNYYANGWAWAGSTPFQWMKYAASHFGATRNPLVVSWPARIKDSGALRAQFTHVIDVAATLYEVSGIRFPPAIDGIEQVPLDGISFAYTFEQPDVPSRHSVQYFEIAGNRAIYKDGWVAAALHTQPLEWPASLSGADDFSRDRWELYNIAEDFSQARDVAAQYPNKLHELQMLFDEQARNNQVYPLGASYGTKAPRMPQLPQKSEYVYYARFPGIPTPFGPNLHRSHRIDAHVYIPDDSVQGVIMAAGGREGGFALYVKDRRLIFENNYSGQAHDILAADEMLCTGHCRLGYELIRGDEKPSSKSLVRLYVDGRQAGAETLSPVGSPQILDNFDVGQDSASPVSEAYRPPFKFGGILKKVTVQLQ